MTASNCTISIFLSCFIEKLWVLSITWLSFMLAAIKFLKVHVGSVSVVLHFEIRANSFKCSFFLCVASQSIRPSRVRWMPMWHFHLKGLISVTLLWDSQSSEITTFQFLILHKELCWWINVISRFSLAAAYQLFS